MMTLNDTLAIEEEGDRIAVHEIQSLNLSAWIEQDLEGKAEFIAESSYSSFRFVEIDSQNDQALIGKFLKALLKKGHFNSAWSAPCRPKIDQDGAALHVAQMHQIAIKIG